MENLNNFCNNSQDEATDTPTTQKKSQYSKVIDFKTLYHFLKAVKGNFHNACYVANTCVECNNKRCSDMLLAISADGTPIFIFYDLALKYSGENIQFDEFSGFLTLNDFENLYGVWLRKYITEPKLCPAKYFKHILKNNGLESEVL